MDIIINIIGIYLKTPKLPVLLIFAVIFSILTKIYYPKFRGKMGEYWLKLELNRLPKNKYIILNDIMVKDSRGTHQIDHIVLSNYGIFVIEMKNYYGLIKGNEYDNKWCQYLGKTRNYFMNPIHQNYGHVKSLSTLLNIDEKYFIPIVCFSNQAKVRVLSKSIVTQVDFINREILKYSALNNNFDINSLLNIITSNNIVNKDQRKEHVNKIHNKIRNDSLLERNMICPKCRNNLVERTGKYGKFIGCSNYPKCKYIKK